MHGKAKGEVYGAVTIGEKGQIVIPAHLRKSFHLKPQDKLIVVTKHEMIGLIPAAQFSKFISQATRMLAKFKKIKGV